MPKQALVTVEKMSIRLGGVKVVSNLSFSVHHNEILGVVGESGSGKSVTAMSLMGLLPNQGDSLHASRMDFAGQSLIPFDEKQFQALRGKQMGMVFQDPMSALNPSMRCGKQVLEMLDLHSPHPKKNHQANMLSLLDKVKLPDPKSIANRYPHQLSGGQQQRVLIAIAIACNPKLLIADEPTTALDPEVQEEIMALLKSIQSQNKMSIVLISHDLNLVQHWTLGNCLLKLTQPDRGEIYYSGTKIDTLKGEVLKQYRKDVQLIFQDPFSSLNPKQKVEKILTEPMLVHNIGANKAERIDRAVQLLEQVGLEAAHMNAYPHVFSGGQRQRIGIARALAIEPKLVVCDESVSALDRSVQAQVLNLLNELKETYGFTYLFIAHDLEVVRYMSNRILHLQNGNIMALDEADAVYQQIRDHQTQKTS